MKSNATKFGKLDLTPNLSSNGLCVGLHFLKTLIGRMTCHPSQPFIYIKEALFGKL